MASRARRKSTASWSSAGEEVEGGSEVSFAGAVPNSVVAFSLSPHDLSMASSSAAKRSVPTMISSRSAFSTSRAAQMPASAAATTNRYVTALAPPFATASIAICVFPLLFLTVLEISPTINKTEIIDQKPAALRREGAERERERERERGGMRKPGKLKDPRRKRPPLVTPEDLAKKDYHYEKRLRQGLKQAVKFELRKIARRTKGGDGAEGSDKVAEEMEAARGADVDAVCARLRAEVVAPPGAGEEGGPATTAGRDGAGAPQGDGTMVDRIARHKCVRDAVSEWKAARGKLLKQMALQQKRQRDEEAAAEARRGEDPEAEKRERREAKKRAKAAAAAAAGSPQKDQVKKKQPQKKRMGQRARRLMAEKIYGWEANHLQVKVSEDHPYWKNASREHKEEFEAKADAGKGGEGARRVKPASAQPEEENLHPSWQAKKLAKKKMVPAGSSGKKIVFD